MIRERYRADGNDRRLWMYSVSAALVNGHVVVRTVELPTVPDSIQRTLVAPWL